MSLKISCCFLGLFCLVSGLADQSIYKQVDPKGNVTFSDKPQQGAGLIELKALPTYQPSQKANTVSATNLDQPPVVPSLEIPYQRIQILKPTNEETIWDNEGNLTVKVAVYPSLRAEDTLVLLLDGKPIKKLTGTTQVELQGIDRGTHTLSAVLQGQGGESLQSSPTITIFLHKASTYMPSRSPSHNRPLP